MILRFSDRVDADRRLEKLLVHFSKQESLILTPLNGSILIGKTLSKRLGIPMDLLPVSPIHHPVEWNEVIGAVSAEDIFLPAPVSFVDPNHIISVIRQRQIERTASFKNRRLFYTLKNKTVIIIVEGSRTAAQLIPCIHLMNRMQPAKIIVAAPVIAAEAKYRLHAISHEVISLFNPMPYDSTPNF